MAELYTNSEENQGRFNNINSILTEIEAQIGSFMYQAEQGKRGSFNGSPSRIDIPNGRRTSKEKRSNAAKDRYKTSNTNRNDFADDGSVDWVS